jgi:manganese transport protein
MQAQRRRVRLGRALALMGPAFVAAIAYVDPGNFATNFAAGASFRYSLAWVIVLANVVAMLVQYLAAKVGVATGKDLPELCRERLPLALSRSLWVQAEVVAMVTDVAEFVGAAIGLNLLFGVPLPVSGVLTALVAFAILALDQRGYRRFELAITGLLGIVLLGFAYDLAAVHPPAAAVAAGLIPALGPRAALTLTAGIVGATVMPHVIYLHGALTKPLARGGNGADPRAVLRFQRLDVLIALGAAGVVNLVMLVVAAALASKPGGARGLAGNAIDAAHADLGRLVGGGAALAFAVALLASGLSSSSVGTFAGQVVMRGFVGLSVPLFVRRAVTMLPAIVVLAAGFPLTTCLVVSQVVLSFGIPFALVPLVAFTRRRDIMGPLANRPLTTAAGACAAAAIIALNAYLLCATFTS